MKPPLKSQSPSATPRLGADIERCASGGCEYLERDPDTGKLRECGQPALWRHNRARGLRYCQECSRYVARHFELVRYEGGGQKTEDGGQQPKTYTEKMRADFAALKASLATL